MGRKKEKVEMNEGKNRAKEEEKGIKGRMEGSPG